MCSARAGHKIRRIKKTSHILAVLLLSITAFAASAGPPSPLKGAVLVVRDVEIHIDLRLKTSEGEVWAVVTKAPVKKGAQVTINNPLVMQNFEGKSR